MVRSPSQSHRPSYTPNTHHARTSHHLIRNDSTVAVHVARTVADSVRTVDVQMLPVDVAERDGRKIRGKVELELEGLVDSASESLSVLEHRGKEGKVAKTHRLPGPGERRRGHALEPLATSTDCWGDGEGMGAIRDQSEHRISWQRDPGFRT